jgi:hypothetical protein
MSYREESAYGRDPRVMWPGFGSPSDVFAALYNPEDEDSTRIIMPSGEGMMTVVVRGNFTTDADVTDPDSGRLWQFGSIDEALAAVIGEPVAPPDEPYGATGAGADWIRDNVGLD